MIRSRIRRDVSELKTSADLHAWTGANAAHLINSAGRMVWMVASAAVACGINEDDPDTRILRGMAEAVADLAADGRMEFHRPSIQAGLLAVERLLPKCSDWALGTAALDLDRLLGTSQGMGTSDISAIFEQNKAAQS